jgi:hypothetical protein
VYGYPALTMRSSSASSSVLDGLSPTQGVVPRAVHHEFGTSYHGKECADGLNDVLREATRRLGAFSGLEPGLTTRPFTAVTYRADRPGSMSHGAANISRDLADALAILTDHGCEWWPYDGDAATFVGRRPRVAIVGPLSVSSRLVPPEARICHGGVSRYVVADGLSTDGRLRVIDPVFGGHALMSLPPGLDPTTAFIILSRTGRRLSNQRLTASIVARGLTRRMDAATDPVRDAQGLRRLRDEVPTRLGREFGFRLSAGFRELALQRHYWGCLLGWAAAPTPATLAMADILRRVIDACGAGMSACDASSTPVVRDALSQLFRLEALLTEMCPDVAA